MLDRVVRLARPGLVAAALLAASHAPAAGTAQLDAALQRLTLEGQFSGAVVVRGTEGVRFARGYGLADPFAGRTFTPTTPVDSGSLAKPVTAAAVLLLAREGRIDLDAPVRRYLPEYPHVATTVRHLLAHSAGLGFDNSPAHLAGKSNAMLLAGSDPPQFTPGSAFSYCNACGIALALLIERVTGMSHLEFARQRLALPHSISVRPGRLADWQGRAIGYRQLPDGSIARNDSWEGELFYGPANLSVSAEDLADWGTGWWRGDASSLRAVATAPARIGGRRSGLSWGNWYCAPDRRRCHYIGHHEGFHHMLYWDARRRLSVAMVSNNRLAPGLQQRLQRALVAFAQGEIERVERELASPLADLPPPAGRFRLGSGETVTITAVDDRLTVRRRGLEYAAFPVGAGIRYVPGLDVYLAGDDAGGLAWLSLYDDRRGRP